MIQISESFALIRSKTFQWEMFTLEQLALSELVDVKTLKMDDRT